MDVGRSDREALEESLDVLASEDLVRQLAESRVALAAGDVLDAEELGSLMAPGEARGDHRF